jgi:hypothetical protein
MVLITARNPFPLCYDCQKGELNVPVRDPKMKKLFSIPEDFYRTSSFLRSIKINYHRFGKLTEKQVDAFRKTVDNLKNAPKR